MLSQDLLEDRAVQFTPTHRIPAQNIHVVRLDELVTEFLHPNRCLCITLCPQEMYAFSEDCNMGMPALCSVGCSENEAAKGFHESIWIRHAIEHDCRERVSSIYRDVPTLLHSRTDIQATCLQLWKEIVPV